MGKVMAKTAVIFGQSRPVELKHYASQQRALDGIISNEIGVEHHGDVNWSGVRVALASAQKDSEMDEAHVKVGVIDGDLIWRAKANQFKGEKEYDVILVRHYTRLVEEQEKFTSGLFRTEGSIHDPDGPLPRPAGLTAPHPAMRSAADEFEDILEELKEMPGYFGTLTSKEVAAKLKGKPLNSWLVRASSGGGVTWSVREKNDRTIQNYRILNESNYERFKEFIAGPGHSLQVTA